MNDEDLRDLFAMAALIAAGEQMGLPARIAKVCYQMADAMLEAKYAPPETGIVAAKRTRRKTNE